MRIDNSFQARQNPYIYNQKSNVVKEKKSNDFIKQELPSFYPIYFAGKGDKVNNQINLSTQELEKRTSPEHFMEIRLLKPTSEVYLNLKDGDKKALKHLLKAAVILEDVYLKQNHPENIEFRNYLKKEVKKGNNDAKMALRLFNGQKGIISKDIKGNVVVLKKGATTPPGRGHYQQDLTKEEYQELLVKMIKKGEIDEVKKILNQRSVVKRSKDGLVAVDYTKEYEKEFKAAAKEIEIASRYSTNKDFNKFLRLQAKALRENNPLLDAVADKQWAELQDTPLEFTITRECYNDDLLNSIYSNEELTGLLSENKIKTYAKDDLGVRVGIINKKGTDHILNIGQNLALMAENMPLKEEYQRHTETKKQTMVDADIVYQSGQVGAYNGAIVIAENLPNNDKLALKIGGGRRNVYHRQMMNNLTPEKAEERAKTLLNPEIQKYYNPATMVDFCIGHENIHSLGPLVKDNSTGRLKSIIEENKADTGALAMLDVLIDAGVYTEKQKREIITTAIEKMIPLSRVDVETSSAHRVKELIQLNYYFDNKVINLDEDGRLDIDFEKVVPVSKMMLEDIIEVQLKNDKEFSKAYVDKYTKWPQEIQELYEKKLSVNQYLNGYLTHTLADYLLEKEL